MCPSCGHPNPQAAYLSGGQVFMGLLIAAGAIWFMATPGCDLTPATSTPTSAVSTSAAPQERLPFLKLKSFRCTYEHGYATVVGEVANVTVLKLENVMAVASHYTAAGELITTDDSIIDFNPILAGQTSPFKVMSTHNPAMKRCSVNFKSMFGGAIRWQQKDGTLVN